MLVDFCDGEDPLVAIALDNFASEDLLCRDRLLPDPLKGGIDPIELETQLFPVTHVSTVAAAAFSKPGTIRHKPLG